MLRNSVYRGKFNIEVLELTFGLTGFYLVLRLNGVRINCVIRTSRFHITFIRYKFQKKLANMELKIEGNKPRKLQMSTPINFEYSQVSWQFPHFIR